MIYMFVNLACKSILFGSFADMVNEMLALDYSMECASYYGELKEWDSRSVLGDDRSPIQPYSAFGQVGEHNGMRLTTGLLKCLFYVHERSAVILVSCYQNTFWRVFQFQGQMVASGEL
jgi:hypothetical protein